MPRMGRITAEGDRDRLTCLDCGYVVYENPKVITGSVVNDGAQILLCRRAIAPRIGYWTLPAGYLELGETVAEGAAREAWEEARARIAIEGVLAVFDIARIGQVQVIHRARFADAERHHAPGPESLETRLFPVDALPLDDLAFPSVRWALDAHRARLNRPLGAPASNPSSDPRGTIAPEGSENIP
jgi:ADP-ribose pyrophosphatase YjhB (NUDIX family)